MALVKYGGGIIGMSGSIAGNTHAHNRFGSYVRARTKPINPKTARQEEVRASLAFLTERWANGITVANRTAWNLYGASVAMKNRLDKVIYLTGFNHFIRSNMNLWIQNGTLYAAGPTVFELPAKDGTFAIAASEATQQITITANGAMPWANEDQAYMYIFQGRPQNAQRNFFAGPWKRGGFFAGAAAGPPGFPLPVTAQWAIAAGQRIWCYARVVRADGRLSEPFRADTFCAA